MTLAPGTRLGKYEIVALLGAGGMGEVYRARDTELKHEVAIKVLLESFVRDSERIARFEREARMLAQMSHPNIGFIHDLKRDDDRVYLVLELVPGATLADRLTNGPLPVREALGLFRQIAMALEATHSRGVVHRDLKPENVKITTEGLVKVLDFGLAKEVFESTESTDGKTQTQPPGITKDRAIVGTVAYMSPEQARGHPVDKRTDIWSFGCCLFETLSGRRPFEGKSLTDVLAAVVKEEPKFESLPSEVPADILKLLKRCLQKDLNQRLRDIGDARLEIESALEAREAPAVGRFEGVSRGWAAILAGITLGAGVLVARLVWPPIAPPMEMVHRFTLALPPTEPLALDAGPALALASDGSSLAYTARWGDSTELRRRSMDRLEPARIPGTEGALGPFFNAGTNEVGFFAKSQIYRLPSGDAPAVSLGESLSPRGASWASDLVVFSPRTESGLSRVSSPGTSPTALTNLDSDKAERSHRWPSILPGRKHVLFTSWSREGFDIEAAALDGGARTLLVENGTYPRFATSGHLLFVRDSALWAQVFDESSLELSGAATKVVESVHFDELTGAAFYDVSSNGTLVYAPREEARGDEGYSRLLAIDPGGGTAVLSPVPRVYGVPRLAPSRSGTEVLTIVADEGGADVWLIDRARSSASRKTFDGQNYVAVWSFDGTRIAVASQRGDAINIFSKAVDSSEPDRRLTESPNMQFPTSWSVDGRLAFVEIGLETKSDIWIWSERGVVPFQSSRFSEKAAVFSPDGKFVAYVSDETGEDQVYVRPADGSPGKWTISTTGGREPVWRPDKIFYRDEERMMEVGVELEGGFEPGKPQTLFEAPIGEAESLYANYDVSENGKEFIMVRIDEGREAERLIIVTDWFKELKEQVPTGR
jgi:serine/threonine-protein kinase